MIDIDGSAGEGGGQILRSALALSILTGQAFHIQHIRAQRSEPGLKAQHLTAVQAAAAISRAEVSGASLHSQTLNFEPGPIRTGHYKFEIGTAGAVTLLLQTILLPLSQASSATSLILSGGTHVSWSPPYPYLAEHWLAHLEKMGVRSRIQLDTAGFYPQGGGRIQAITYPASSIAPLNLTERGRLIAISGHSAVANLDMSIANRQKQRAIQRLTAMNLPVAPRIKSMELPSPGKGTILFLQLEFEHSQACFSALGKLGKSAEKVADEVIDELAAFLETPAAVDAHLADQLLLPAALASGASTFTTCVVTQHLLSQAEIIRQFLPTAITIKGSLGEPGLVQVIPSPPGSTHGA